jgi:phage terminase large subunit-like protein
MATASRIRTTTSKIPRDFVSRTLKRLLPKLEYIETLTKEQLVQLAVEKKRLSQLITQDPARFFKPNNGGQKGFLTYWDYDREGKRVLIFPAGNKAGKTTAGAILVGERLLGEPLWDRDKRKNLSWRKVPATGICFAEDFESHRDTILPTIKSWWGKHIKRISYTQANCPSELELDNGSICKFKTYAQGAETAEGKDWDIVWDDEPPTHDIYTAQFRGIVSTGGQIIVTATLLKEAWIYDEIDQPYAMGFAASIHDNDWVDEDAKQAFLDALSPEEREVRETGKPFNLTGIIYRYFKDQYPYVIDPFVLPDTWPYFIGVDPHERKPVHVGFFTLTPQNETVLVGYGLFKGDITEIFKQLDSKILEIGIPKASPIRIAVMDPNRGSARQINKISWQQVFEEQGYDVVLGNDDLNIGHAKMFEAFRINPNTGRPSLMITNNCRGRMGPIWQLQRYSWDEWATSKMRSTRDVKEKPKDRDKDFPDIFRYVMMAGLDFKGLTKGHEVISFINEQTFRPYGRVGGRRGAASARRSSSVNGFGRIL